MDAIPLTPLGPKGTRDWESRRHALRSHPALPLRQSWLEEPEPLFAPGQVRVGLAGMAIAVHATLKDRDVFNPVKRFNTAAFPHGDIFEMLIKPEGQESYFEFHVTPGGTLLQLRWPASMRSLPLDWSGAADPLAPYKIDRWRIRAQARVIRQGWDVTAEIPLKRIFESDVPWERSKVRMCFARYDHTRGRLRPVLSSTALLTERDFHRTAEWQCFELHFH